MGAYAWGSKSGVGWEFRAEGVEGRSWTIRACSITHTKLFLRVPRCKYTVSMPQFPSASSKVKDGMRGHRRSLGGSLPPSLLGNVARTGAELQAL